MIVGDWMTCSSGNDDRGATRTISYAGATTRRRLPTRSDATSVSSSISANDWASMRRNASKSGQPGSPEARRNASSSHRPSAAEATLAQHPGRGP